MHDAQLMQILDAADDLLEEFAGLGLLELLLFDDVVEELAAAHELHDQKQLLRRLDDLEQLDDVRVPDQLEDVDFARDALYVSISSDFALFEDFDRHLGKQTHYSLGWEQLMKHAATPRFASYDQGP